MKTLFIKTKGFTDIIDITNLIQKEIEKESFEEGLVFLFVLGTTAAITTIEADKNLYRDLKEVLEKILPYKKDYYHHRTWGDDNGSSHLRASLFNSSLFLPVKNRKLYLGIWQRVVLIDFDTKERERQVIINFFKNS